MGAIEALGSYGIKVGINAIRGGLYNTLWPGRCEIVSRKPLIVLDGAQNIASARALKEAIKNNFKYSRLILVLGISKDKDIKGVCRELYDLADEVVLTQANNPRASEPEVLARYFKAKKTHSTSNVKEAGVAADRLARDEDLILITGSLFVIGEYRDV